MVVLIFIYCELSLLEDDVQHRMQKFDIGNVFKALDHNIVRLYYARFAELCLSRILKTWRYAFCIIKPFSDFL